MVLSKLVITAVTQFLEDRSDKVIVCLFNKALDSVCLYKLVKISPLLPIKIALLGIRGKEYK